MKTIGLVCRPPLAPVLFNKDRKVYNSSPQPRQVTEQGVGMAEDTLLASISEGIGHASIIAPGDDSSILHIILEQVSGPEDVPTRPSLQSRAAKSVDEDEIGSAGVPFAVVREIQRPNAIAS